MRSNSLWLSSLAALSLVFSGSLGCSSSTSTPDGGGGVGGGGGRGGVGGGGGRGGVGGLDASAAGTTADGSTVDAPDAAGFDAAFNRDAYLADISPEVSKTDGPESLLLSSPDLAEGAAFLSANTCAGANASPPLAWTAGPTGTLSYAIVLTDLSINAVHWVIWDIPATTTSLPFGLPDGTTLTSPAGAKQVHKVEFFGAGGAYRGPCPSGANHIYQFEVNAIPTATLAVAGSPTTEGVKASIQAVSLTHGGLEGSSNATRPPAVDAAGQ